MTSLYPRLLPGDAEALFRRLHRLDLPDIEGSAELWSDRAVFAASGGTRVTQDHLASLRANISREARLANYPHSPSVRDRNKFDSATARILVVQSDMTPGEAAQPQVWAFLALVVMPHICAWRFPPRTDGTYVADRFKGSDLTRHALGRLWTRAYILQEPASESDETRFRLLDVLGEADIDQIMARRDSVAASPALVRSIVRSWADDAPGDDEIPARQLLRETLMRLLRLTAFLNLESYSNDELDALVGEVRQSALKDLRSAL
jgi:hypothetical protein